MINTRWKIDCVCSESRGYVGEKEVAVFAPQNYCSRNIFPYEICVHTCLYLYDRILLLILFTRVLVNIAFGSIVAIVIRAVIDYSNFTTRREGLHIGRSLSFFHAKRKHVVLECGSRMEVILEVRQTRAGRQNASNKRDSLSSTLLVTVPTASIPRRGKQAARYLRLNRPIVLAVG